MALSECLIVPGPYAVTGSWNMLSDPATTVTLDGGASTTHPAALMWDGNPGKPGRFLTDGTDRKVNIDFGSARKVTLLTIHYHNLTTGITAIELRASSDATFATDNNLIAKILPLYKRPAMYAYNTGGLTKRYWRVVFIGTNGSPIWIGEMTLSQPTALTTRPLIPIEAEHIENHVEYESGSGRGVAHEKTAWEKRHVMLSFEDLLSCREEALDLFWTARGRLHPLVCVPLAPSTYSTDGSGNQVFGDCEKVALFGKFEPGRLIEGTTYPTMAEWSLGIQEDPSTEPLA